MLNILIGPFCRNNIQQQLEIYVINPTVNTLFSVRDIKPAGTLYIPSAGLLCFPATTGSALHSCAPVVVVSGDDSTFRAPAADQKVIRLVAYTDMPYCAQAQHTHRNY